MSATRDGRITAPPNLPPCADSGKGRNDKAPSLAVGGVSAGVCGETRQPS